VFVYQHRVRSHEVDAQGFVFNSRYLEIADVAMTEFFRGIGWPYPKLVAGGTDPSVVSAAMTFLAPAKFDDLLDVHVACRRVGTSSFRLDMNVNRGETKIAGIELVYVNVDPAAEQSRPLPAPVAEALRDVTAA
jgi:acyl-CoA thioester hydrolase